MRNKIPAIAYQTHIEIPNYTKGMLPYLERSLQTYGPFKNKIDVALDLVNNTLYIPRSMQPNLLSSLDLEINNDMIEYATFKSQVFRKPKDTFQERSIEFLSGDGNFYLSRKSSQIVLSAPPGSGKTYCAVHAISRYGIRTMVVCHRKKILTQWMEEILTSTDIQPEDILFLDSNKCDRIIDNKYDIHDDLKVVLVLQQTIAAFAKKHGWDKLSVLLSKLKIGIKIIDEAHRHFRNTFLIDAYANLNKSIYLTATFKRSAWGENKVFQNAYSITPKFGFERIKETRRHIIYIEVRFNSYPDTNETLTMYNGLGFFDKMKYTEYQNNHPYIANSIKALMDKYFLKHEGRYLILSATKDSNKYYKKIMDESYPNMKTCIYNSDISDDDKRYAMDNAEIICSTPSSLGEGTNMKHLRYLFMTDAFVSEIDSFQNPSRLREYAPDKNCFYIEFIDEGFKQVVEWQKRRKKEFEKFFLEDRVVKYTDLMRDKI
jgi:DEAD/DEAH box helicase